MARKVLMALATACLATVTQAADFEAGATFRDCVDCPELVVIPAGRFRMGTDAPSAKPDARPAHEVTVSRFAIGRTEVTRAQYRLFASETGRGASGPCTSDPDLDGRWQDVPAANWEHSGFPSGEDHPVTCVTWADASAYADWLAAKTGEPYRLLSEAEWEYAARAGTTSEYPWGDAGDGMCAFANGPDDTVFAKFPGWSRAKGAACDDGEVFTAVVASYKANGFGIYDMPGNVWEWTADCYEPDYTRQPRDGSAYTEGACTRRALRGGSWVYGIGDLTSAQRNGLPRPGQRGADIGFRVARGL
jgi:formylglycine-generating enzyme required for sulfatase activity